LAAKNAGMFAVGLLTTYSPVQFHNIADKTVAGFDELLQELAMFS
jgi:phosphoglycolate phosphatase-like HAD superfamily hydrolase